MLVIIHFIVRCTGHVVVALVMIQMVFPSELCITLGAREWFLASVYEHVSFELIRIGEFRRTQFTVVWSLPSMDAQMAPQISYLYEVTITV